MVTNKFRRDKGGESAVRKCRHSARLLKARGLIVAFAALLVGVAVAEVIGVTAAFGVFAALIVLIALISRQEGVAGPTSVSWPANQTWPDTGIKLFAEALPDPCMVLDRRGIVRFRQRARARPPFRSGPAIR